MTRQQLITAILERLTDAADDLAFGLPRERAAEVERLVGEIRRVAAEPFGEAEQLDPRRIDG